MYKPGIFLLLIVISNLLLSCGKKKEFSPPAGAEIVRFTENSSAKQRVIYQSETLRSFSEGESVHIYWAGIMDKPSHRMNIRLLGNSNDILFTVTFPGSKKKLFCEAIKDKDIIGNEVMLNTLTENEFIIEVIAPIGLKHKKNLEYRLFIGIHGTDHIDFYKKKSNE